MRILLCTFLSLSAYGQRVELPAKLDLRTIDGKNLVSSVKKQSGGTCWTHGAIAALESNLLKTGVWSTQENGEANLAEYHMDWWNGFNKHYNGDLDPDSGGLTVHEGGDYRVAAAYLARGGAVRDTDAQSFGSAPAKNSSQYHYYYVRDIEWMSQDRNREGIQKIKQAIADHGVIGTALAWDPAFFSTGNKTFYQPDSSHEAPNHAVAIVGWDDDKLTQSPNKGAWLVKNSWGTSWGNSGYFWISYDDKVSTHHEEMGAVSFRNVERLKYDKIYSHDYHGWRDTLEDSNEAFNAFTANGRPGSPEILKSVSFYTPKDETDYAVHIFLKYQNGELSELTSVKEGHQTTAGFHTVDLNWPVSLSNAQKFYIYVQLSKGGLAYDRTSDVPVLLGGGERTIVESRANHGESFYRKNGAWVDLTGIDESANFCIKGLAVNKI